MTVAAAVGDDGDGDGDGDGDDDDDGDDGGYCCSNCVPTKSDEKISFSLAFF